LSPSPPKAQSLREFSNSTSTNAWLSGECFLLPADIPVKVKLEGVKTNATRILDSLGIPYELREYDVDPADLSAETVAAKIGMPAEQVFKTLVVRGDRGGVYLAVIPGNSELDAKALARVTGDRRVELAALKEVQPFTGYIRGGVTALGAKKNYPVYIDETAQLFDVISVSAGVRGTQMLLAPDDYLRAVQGNYAAIAKGKP
jgi:Cys-tRNA(Pro)/Cys-tRNA(Cys) deacylase